MIKRSNKQQQPPLLKSEHNDDNEVARFICSVAFVVASFCASRRHKTVLPSRLEIRHRLLAWFARVEKEAETRCFRLIL